MLNPNQQSQSDSSQAVEDNMRNYLESQLLSLENPPVVKTVFHKDLGLEKNKAKVG